MKKPQNQPFKAETLSSSGAVLLQSQEQTTHNDLKKKNTRRRYDADFRAEALKMLGSGRAVREVAQVLCVSEQLLYNWQSQARKSTVHNADADVAAAYQEVEALKKQVKRLQMEQEILKKVLFIMNPQPQP